jgi:hypothetical protein
MGWDGMGWDGMGWDGMGWDGMGWDGMGWDGMEWMCVFFFHSACEFHLRILVYMLLVLPQPCN